jgi:hypothetical protein
MWLKDIGSQLEDLYNYMDKNGSNADVYQTLVTLENLRDFRELDQQAVTDFIEWYKKLIVKDILNMVKAPFDYDINVYLKMLYRLGAEWPELEIIDRSINSEVIRENRYSEYRTQYVTQHEADIMSAFQRGILQGINRLWFYTIKADEIDRVKDMIEDHKDTLIKLILTYLRHGDMTDYGTAKGIIIKLQNAGITWPELDIAMRSILNAFEDDNKNYN